MHSAKRSNADPPSVVQSLRLCESGHRHVKQPPPQLPKGPELLESGHGRPSVVPDQGGVCTEDRYRSIQRPQPPGPGKPRDNRHDTFELRSDNRNSVRKLATHPAVCRKDTVLADGYNQCAFLRTDRDPPCSSSCGG